MNGKFIRVPRGVEEMDEKSVREACCRCVYRNYKLAAGSKHDDIVSGGNKLIKGKSEIRSDLGIERQ